MELASGTEQTSSSMKGVEMRRKMSLFAAVTVLTGLMSVALPTASWAASSDRTSPAAFCVKVQTGVEPHHAHVGDAMSAFGSWENCGRSLYLRFRFRLEAPCGHSFLDSGHIRLRSHSGFAEAVGGFKACKGTYRATVLAFGNGHLLDRMSRRVHVRP